MHREGMAGLAGNLEAEPPRSAPPMRTFPHASRSFAARLPAPAALARPWRAAILLVVAVAALVPAVTRPAAAARRPARPPLPASGLYLGASPHHAPAAR